MAPERRRITHKRCILTLPPEEKSVRNSLPVLSGQTGPGDSSVGAVECVITSWCGWVITSMLLEQHISFLSKMQRAGGGGMCPAMVNQEGKTRAAWEATMF
jgi:hypothetical protein